MRPTERSLAAIVADRNSRQKHVWRARIVLLTADGVGTNEIMRQAGTSKVTVWRSQERFMQAGIEGLLHDKTRPSRTPPLPASVRERTVAMTLGDPPGEATHWTAAMTPKPPASASPRCSAFGARTACSRTGCANSSCRAIPISYPS